MAYIAFLEAERSVEKLHKRKLQSHEEYPFAISGKFQMHIQHTYGLTERLQRRSKKQGPGKTP
jgi:hypothetical protein